MYFYDVLRNKESRCEEEGGDDMWGVFRVLWDKSQVYMMGYSGCIKCLAVVRQGRFH